MIRLTSPFCRGGMWELKFDFLWCNMGLYRTARGWFWESACHDVMTLVPTPVCTFTRRRWSPTVSCRISLANSCKLARRHIVQNIRREAFHCYSQLALEWACTWASFSDCSSSNGHIAAAFSATLPSTFYRNYVLPTTTCRTHYWYLSHLISV